MHNIIVDRVSHYHLSKGEINSMDIQEHKEISEKIEQKIMTYLKEAPEKIPHSDKGWKALTQEYNEIDKALQDMYLLGTGWIRITKDGVEHMPTENITISFDKERNK